MQYFVGTPFRRARLASARTDRVHDHPDHLDHLDHLDRLNHPGRRLPLMLATAVAGLLLGGCRTHVQPSGPADDGAIAAPVRYDAHRFFLRPVTTDGDTLVLFTDTGGDNLISASAIKRAGLTATARVGQRGDTTWVMQLPPFRDGARVPFPAPDAPPILDVASERSVAEMAKLWPGTRAWSGQLGAKWFGDGVWTFDYGRGQLLLHPRSYPPLAAGPHVIPLAFKVVAGLRPSNFARLRAEVDGDSLDLLFDTGATVTLTDSAWRVVGDALPRERATSFIAASVFDRWRSRHPDWRVIERAEYYTAREMIEVPAVSIARFSVGPVWFTRRLDAEFVPYVSAGTDRTVIGALGGSAYQYFVITADYRRGLAQFSRAR
jgi:hypothetical protein